MSLTAVCYKVLEHIIYHHIIEYLLQYIIHNYQHGFWQGYSVKSQLITIIEVCNKSQVTNRCYTFRLPKGI